MRLLGDKFLKPSVAKMLIGNATCWIYDGTFNDIVKKKMDKCNMFHVNSQSMLIFVRDQGMHEQGWLNSPETNQCWHLTLSYKTLGTDGEVHSLPHDITQSREWCELIFDIDFDKVFIESPYSEDGVREDVLHFRVFCNDKWTPIIPEGELFDKDVKENGWQTWKQMDEEIKAAEDGVVDEESDDKALGDNSIPVPFPLNSSLLGTVGIPPDDSKSSGGTEN